MAEDASVERGIDWSERGRVWTEWQPTLDAQLQPLGETVLARLHPSRGDRVLDVGCGSGTTALELAESVGEDGAVTGIDLSVPLLELARRRAADRGTTNVTFVEGDAQTYPFPPHEYDVVFSRLGTMFFDEPTAAFSNLRRAMRPGGRLGFVCWRPLEENPWALEPRLAVAAIVPALAEQAPKSAGPWSLGDPAVIHEILTGADFRDVEVTPHDQPLLMGRGNIDEGVEFLLQLLTTGYLLIEPDHHVLGRVKAALRAVLERHHSEAGVWMGSGSWVVTAR